LTLINQGGLNVETFRLSTHPSQYFQSNGFLELLKLQLVTQTDPLVTVMYRQSAIKITI